MFFKFQNHNSHIENFYSTTQIRWVQHAGVKNTLNQGSRVIPWGLDDVYVGLACPLHCRGRGDCVEGKCICDEGFYGL